MQIVQSAALYPGCCALSGESQGPFLDTDQDKMIDGRIYLSLAALTDFSAQAGLPTIHAVSALQEQLEAAEERAEFAENRARELEAIIEEAESLRVAIAYTMERGFVLDPKRGTVGLRAKPGTARIDVAKSLYGTRELVAS